MGTPAAAALVTVPSPPLAAIDPAADPQLREVGISGTQVYRGHFLDVRRDAVRLPDGAVAVREYIVHPGAVMVVPLLPDGRLVVERQYRYPMGRAMLEFPAGKLDAGEVPLACAVRELAEETGYRAGEWARAGLLHNAIAYSTEGIEVWFARSLTLGEPRLEAGEFLDVAITSEDEFEPACRTRRSDRRQDAGRPAVAGALACRTVAPRVACRAMTSQCR